MPHLNRSVVYLGAFDDWTIGDRGAIHQVDGEAIRGSA